MPGRREQAPAFPGGAPPRASVVICAYTRERWAELGAAVRSVQDQTPHPHELIVVIDHNPALLERARPAFCHATLAATVIPNAERPGLSGARNTGLRAASGEVVVFLDDDAAAQPGWLGALLAPYADPNVLGVGGRVEPEWRGGAPAWFPDEFLWVVGCSYRGLPARPGVVRNLIGANMSCRRDVALEVGGFRAALGRVGSLPLGGEETEFCIRAGRHFAGGTWLYQPGAAVRHAVPGGRATGRYFLRRCFAEGLSKARVSRFVGPGAALSSELAHAARVLPRGVLRGAREALGGDPAGLRRALAIAAGLTAVAAGYAVGLASPKPPFVRGRTPGPAPRRRSNGAAP